MMILAGVFLFVGVASFLFSSSPEKAHYDVTVQNISSTAADGLDLKAVGELVKKAKDAEELEKLINSKEEGLNNLDLNEDGKVDYISVDEYGNDKAKGFSLTTEPTPGETQELATIDIEKTGDDKAQMEIQGNKQIYGNNHYYHSHFGIMDMLILGYLFRPHGLFMSPFGYGNYPQGYSSYNTAQPQSYRSKTANATRSSNMKSASGSSIKGKAASPNAGRSASSIKAPLKNPTVSQKSFQTRNPSKTVSRGGFGRSASTRATSATSRPSRPSVRSGGFGRSGGSYGGK